MHHQPHPACPPDLGGAYAPVSIPGATEIIAVNGELPDDDDEAELPDDPEIEAEPVTEEYLMYLDWRREQGA
jgi:hypothetical protein